MTALAEQLPRVQLQSVRELRVVCAAWGLAAGVFVKFLVEAGADVTVVKPAGDPLASAHPAQSVWHAGTRAVDASELDAMLDTADVCLVGGEDHPDLERGPAPEELRVGRPRLVVVDVRALDPGRPEDVPQTELLVQAATGLVWDHRSAAPMFATMHPGSYGAALLALLGTFAALVDRERTGAGQVVTTSLEQGIALSWSQMWMDSDPHHPAFDVVAPLDLQHLILPCRDGRHLQLTYGVPGAVRKVYTILGLPTDASETDPGAPRADRGPRNYYGIYDELAAGAAHFDRDDLLVRFREAGIPAEPVLDPGACWDDEQIVANGFIAQSDRVRHVGATVHHRSDREATRAPEPHAAPVSEGTAPLRDLRVLDFGTLVAGPYASTLLTALGATVTKVESASARPSAATVRNAFAVSPGKQSACLDLKSPDGAAVLRTLCSQADVVQHNFRVGVADRLGLDPQSLWQVDPGIATLTTTAFGPVGPKAYDRGLDMVVAAMSGLQVRAGSESPSWYRAPAIDYVCGAMGAIGIVMAYLERLRHGRAPAVETSLLGAALFLQQDLVEHDGEATGLPSLSADGLGTSAWERMYQCADGWVAVVARTSAGQATLAGVGGVDPADSSAEAISEGLRNLRVDDVVAECAGTDAWVVRCVDDAWHRLRTGLETGHAALTSELADDTYGRVIGCFGELVGFSSWPGLESPRPGLARRGSSTDALLIQAGLSADEVARLRSEGAIA